MVHIAVKNVAGVDVIASASYSNAIRGSEMRQIILEQGGCIPGSRFKLIWGSRVLQNTDILEEADPDSIIMLTLVTLPPAGISEEAEALVLPVAEEHELLIKMFDVRTGKEEPLPFRYFLDHDGAANLGVLAVELAPMIGADALSIARFASCQAIYDGEDPSAALLNQSESVWLWEVVGGAEKGGIVVRSAKSFESEPFATRLATGTLVRELALEEGRLHYILVSGKGPVSGWVSVKVKDKVLLHRKSKDVEVFRAVISVAQLPKAFGHASYTWSRKGTFLDVGLKISERFDEIKLAIDNENDIMGHAIKRTQVSMTNWWTQG